MKPDLPSGLLWLAAGAFVAWEGYDLGLGAAHDPGSGFVLFWAGLLLAALAVAQLVQAARRTSEVDGVTALWRGLRWWKPVYAVALLAVYAVALLPVGFLLSTAAFLLVLLLTVDRNPPAVAVGVAVGATAVCYLVFDKWLGVPLPRGIFSL
jgi:putative tricarboxylic transport membrane protein